MAKTRPVEERFWESVTKTDTCWVWTGRCREPSGYGVILLGGRGTKAFYVQKLSYQMHVGQVPEGMRVVQKCGNPKCVNPEHLQLETKQQKLR